MPKKQVKQESLSEQIARRTRERHAAQKKAREDRILAHKAEVRKQRDEAEEKSRAAIKAIEDAAAETRAEITGRIVCAFVDFGMKHQDAFELTDRIIAGELLPLLIDYNQAPSDAKATPQGSPSP
jgi:carbamoylphosphate synthase small subunit